MKTFIALEFDDEFKNRLKSIQNILKEHSYKGRWVNAENFHLTVKFLGETKEDHLEKVDELLESIKNNYNTYYYSLGNLGFFKGNKSLRVVWLGLVGDIERLSMMSKCINEKVKVLGYEIEKRIFKPHITLGREITFDVALDILNEELTELLKYNFKLNKISLMKSEVIEEKRVYKPIISYKLKE